MLAGWLANLPLPDYGRVARHPGATFSEVTYNTHFVVHSPERRLERDNRDKTTSSRRRQAVGHRDPSPQTHASAMACWQVPA
jgi:hypothetical protein